MKPTLIVIPTLDPEQGADTGHRAQISAGCDTRLVVIHDYYQDGYTKTVNRGIKQRQYNEDICLLNDDIEMFNYGWLRALSAALASDPHNGLVVPSGDCASASRHGKLGDMGLHVSNTLPFWCVLLRHELVNEIGLLNEAFIHYSSDTWYCIEAKRAGWRRIWLRSVYLWHRHQGSGFQQEWREHDYKVMQRLLTQTVFRK